MNVLIVDDNDMDLMIIKSFVKAAEMTAIEAKNGHEALQLIADRKVIPDIIVLDWLMPDIDGFELCKKIRALNLEVIPYIILITSSQWTEVEQRSLEIGADDFIEKPVDGNNFIARVRVGERLINMQKKLIELAQTDELTKLLNRRAGIQAIESHLSRLTRSPKPIEHCLIIADIDYFKLINDKHGHLAGDQVLVEIAKRMRESIRPFETVVRFGGEEFLLYCEAGINECEIILNRLKHAVANPPVTINKVSIPVTMSFGCVIIRQPEANQSLDIFIAKADELLYQVKEAGRNDFKIDYAFAK